MDGHREREGCPDCQFVVRWAAVAPRPAGLSTTQNILTISDAIVLIRSDAQQTSSLPLAGLMA